MDSRCSTLNILHIFVTENLIVLSHVLVCQKHTGTLCIYIPLSLRFCSVRNHQTNGKYAKTKFSKLTMTWKHESRICCINSVLSGPLFHMQILRANMKTRSRQREEISTLLLLLLLLFGWCCCYCCHFVL